MCDSRFKHTLGKTARILAVSSFVLAAVVLHPSYQAVQFKSGLSSPVTSRYNVQPSKTHMYREESSFATNLNAKSKRLHALLECSICKTKSSRDRCVWNDRQLRCETVDTGRKV